MPTYNLQAMADKVRYLINQGLDKAKAEAKAFAEFGYSHLPDQVRKEYENLLDNPSKKNPLSRNDADRILDRQNTASQNNIDLTPQTNANPSDHGADSKGVDTGSQPKK